MANSSIIAHWTIKPHVRTTKSVFKIKRAVYFYRFLSDLSATTGGIYTILIFGNVFLLFVIQNIVDLVQINLF